jgi:signal transduction histidine kinase
MRKLNWHTFSRIIWPNYSVSKAAQTINRRWLQKQAFVLGLGSAGLTLVAFPTYHLLTSHYGEATILAQPQRLAVVVTAFLCFMLPLLSYPARRRSEYISALNLFVLFACLAIDIAFSARQRRYTTIGLIPIFGSTFVFTNIGVMTCVYILSAAFFAWLTLETGRVLETILIYLAAYTIAWWMAMIRIRSLYRISFDQARMYERKVYDERVRLARDLHDSLGGDLMQLSLQLRGDTPREQMLELAQSVIARTRTLVATLEPDSDLEPYADYVKNYAERLTRTGKIRVDVVEKRALPELRIDDNINLRAILSEWMTNTMKYSLAKHVQIIMALRGDVCYVLVRDNGTGFRWAGDRRGSGLRNIFLRAQLINAKVFSRRERNGTLFFVKFRSRQ